MADTDYSVEQIPVERTFALRKAVLRPHMGPDDLYECPDDHLPETVAFGAVTAGGSVIGVARITPERPPFTAAAASSWRLRGMAVSPKVRNEGVGSALLQGVIAHVAHTGGGVLWCNARVPARGLYERGGMQPWGEIWEEPDIGPHIVMWRNIL